MSTKKLIKRPDDEYKIYAASSVYKAIPDINITAERPSWQRGLTNYDWSRAKQYYSNPDGTLTPRGFEFLKNVASKNRTGTSNYMRMLNKLSYIPNAAMLVSGAFSGTLANPYLWSALGLASGVQNIKDKNYSNAALDIGLIALGPSVQLINKGVKATKLGKIIRLASELNKATKRVKLPTTSEENIAHNRFRLGDVEIGNPNLLYHVQPDNGVGLLYKQGSGAYIKDGMLFPGKGLKTETPYTWWNLGKPYINKYDIPQTKMLITIPKDNPSMLHVRSQNYPIGQWNGSRGFVTNSEYVSSEPVKIGNQYIFEPGYGYKKLENSNTLNLKDVFNTKISLSHVFPEDRVISNFNSNHHSLVIPSTSDTPVGWGNNPVLFLDKSIIDKYPHQSFIGDGETSTVSRVFHKNNKDLSNYSLSKLLTTLSDKIDKIKELLLPKKSSPVEDVDMVFNSKLRKYLLENNPTAWKGSSYDEMHFHSAVPLENVKYAFLPNDETAPKLLPYFDRFGIKTNFDFLGEEGISLEKFQKWITENDNSVGFREGGKLKLGPRPEKEAVITSDRLKELNQIKLAAN